MEDVEWCMQAERYVDASLQHILSEPNISLPKVDDPTAWLHDKAAEMAKADDVALEKAVQAKGPFWQFARLHQMARSSLIRNFGFSLDRNSGRLLVFIEPLSPTRTIALNVPGFPVKKDHALVQ